MKDKEFQFTPEQRKIIREMCREGTDTDFELFVEVCQIRRLNPIAGQIHATFRAQKNRDGSWGNKKIVIQTGIDGYRLVAERTGKYEGQTKTEWCGKDGKWMDFWPSETQPPFACRLGVYRAGFREPLVKVAYFHEYVQTDRDGQPNRMWKQRAASQLAKCCESLALRAAFPEDLSGIYTDDEMGQADNHQTYEPPKREEPKVADRPAPVEKPAEAAPKPAPTPEPTPPEKAAASPSEAPASPPPAAPTADDAAKQIKYVEKCAAELDGGLNAVEAWTKKVLGASWLKVRKDPAMVKRVVDAINDGQCGTWKTAASTPPPAASAGDSSRKCSCGAPLKSSSKFCDECGSNVGAEDPFRK